jgi:hypothetical protein
MGYCECSQWATVRAHNGATGPHRRGRISAEDRSTSANGLPCRAGYRAVRATVPCGIPCRAGFVVYVRKRRSLLHEHLLPIERTETLLLIRVRITRTRVRITRTRVRITLISARYFRSQIRQHLRAVDLEVAVAPVLVLSRVRPLGPRRGACGGMQPWRRLARSRSVNIKIKSSRVESNRIEPNRIESNRSLDASGPAPCAVDASLAACHAMRTGWRGPRTHCGVRVRRCSFKALATGPNNCR